MDEAYSHLAVGCVPAGADDPPQGAGEDHGLLRAVRCAVSPHVPDEALRVAARQVAGVLTTVGAAPNPAATQALVRAAVLQALLDYDGSVIAPEVIFLSRGHPA